MICFGLNLTAHFKMLPLYSQVLCKFPYKNLHLKNLSMLLKTEKKFMQYFFICPQQKNSANFSKVLSEIREGLQWRTKFLIFFWFGRLNLKTQLLRYQCELEKPESFHIFSNFNWLRCSLFCTCQKNFINFFSNESKRTKKAQKSWFWKNFKELTLKLNYSHTHIWSYHITTSTPIWKRKNSGMFERKSIDQNTEINLNWLI